VFHVHVFSFLLFRSLFFCQAYPLFSVDS
jgi:hypothetical protein